MRRRGILLVAAAILVLGNAIFFWNRFSQEGRTEFKPVWIAYSPALEDEQRANPHNTLSSSEWVDARYAALRDKEDPRLHLLVRTAVTCSVREWSLATYLNPDSINPTSEKPAEMPDRLFLGSLSEQQRNCVSGDLPPGYQLAKLAQPQAKMGNDWSAPSLDIPEQSPNWNGRK
ncbi:MAG: hypothetical protein U0975_12850 [Erythrobacter sp.]|nr:hypothetical protein [Erythrobacter sp.]